MSSLPINSSEAFVQHICRKSFLSLWCYNNPIGKKHKELCDILIVCDPYILIISVKSVRFKADTESAAEFDRWERRAVDASVKQIYGAERWLQAAKHVVCNDGSLGVELPAAQSRQVYRIAVAFGSHERVSIKSGDFGKGFVHVMAEQSFLEVFTELDTVEDFVGYIRDKEAFLATHGPVVYFGSESNLLGLYLHDNRTFPAEGDFFLIQDDIWEAIQAKPEFKARKAADRESYAWDDLIANLAGDDGRKHPDDLPLIDRERAVRGMAREDRFCRRALGKSFREFLQLATEGKLRSRIIQSPSGALYVFVFFRKNELPRDRTAELGARCFVARGKINDGGHVVTGIGMSEYDPSIGSATDIMYLDLGDWTPDDDREAQRLENEFGFFHNRPVVHLRQDEYPT